MATESNALKKKKEGACISTVLLTVLHYNALLHTTHYEWRRYAGQLQIQALPPSPACLSVCNTLGAFERLLMRFIHAEKKCVDHHGYFLHNGLAWMDGEGHCYHTNDSRCCSGMAYPGKLHHFKMNEVPGNIYDYITIVVTFGDFLSSLQKISLDFRNNVFCFSWDGGKGRWSMLYLCKTLYLAMEFGFRLKKRLGSHALLAFDNEHKEQKAFLFQF